MLHGREPQRTRCRWGLVKPDANVVDLLLCNSTLQYLSTVRLRPCQNVAAQACNRIQPAAGHRIVGTDRNTPDHTTSLLQRYLASKTEVSGLRLWNSKDNRIRRRVLNLQRALHIRCRAIHQLFPLWNLAARRDQSTAAKANGPGIHFSSQQY